MKTSLTVKKLNDEDKVLVNYFPNLSARHIVLYLWFKVFCLVIFHHIYSKMQRFLLFLMRSP